MKQIQNKKSDKDTRANKKSKNTDEKELTEEEKEKLRKEIKKLEKQSENVEKISNAVSTGSRAVGTAMFVGNRMSRLANGNLELPNIEKVAVLPNIINAGKNVISGITNLVSHSETQINNDMTYNFNQAKTQTNKNDQDEEDENPNSKKSKVKRALKRVGRGIGNAFNKTARAANLAYTTAVLTGLNPIKKGVDVLRAGIASGAIHLPFSESEENMNNYSISFDVSQFLTNDFSSSPSKHRFAKAYAKNVLPGAMVMLGVTGKLGGVGPITNLAGKLMAAKVMSVYSTPDGRLSLELLPVTDPKKDGQLSSGLRVALTEQVSPNEVLTIQNPYGRGMGAATPTYYSETQFAKDLDDAALFSEIEDSYEEYINSGMDHLGAVKEIHDDLSHIGMSEAQIHTVMENFSSKEGKGFNKYLRDQELATIKRQTAELQKMGLAPKTGTFPDIAGYNRQYNLKKWGIDESSRPLSRLSDVGLVPYVKASLLKHAYGSKWHDKVEGKKFEKNASKALNIALKIMNNSKEANNAVLNKKIQNNLELIKSMPDGPQKTALLNKMLIEINK